MILVRLGVLGEVTSCRFRLGHQRGLLAPVGEPGVDPARGGRCAGRRRVAGLDGDRVDDGLDRALGAEVAGALGDRLDVAQPAVEALDLGVGQARPGAAVPIEGLVLDLQRAVIE